MARGKAAGRTLVQHVESKREKTKRAPAKARDEGALDRVLDAVEAPVAAAAPAKKAAPQNVSLRMARVHTVAKRAAEISFRGARDKVLAALAEEVETEVVAGAAASRDLVLVEVSGDAVPVIVGVVQTRIPREVTLKAGTITLEAEREILLRAGRSAFRLREDGDVELVGSRIVTASRGLLRLVGKMLRLN
ncbi:MAG: hypothetical protein ACXWUG_08790 [Polyangiales bacterium]